MATRRSNVGTDQAWQQTQHIDPGDNLLTADGHVVEAGNLLWDTAHHAPAFDLTINGIHTYHVTAGDEEVLVHNTCGELDPQVRLQLNSSLSDARSRPDIGADRNVAVSEFSVDGQSGELLGVSGQAQRPGTVDIPQDPVFEPIVDNFLRDSDAEYKILEELAQRLGPPSPDIVGTVDLLSDFPFCDSCLGIFDQFNARYPGVVLNVGSN